MKGGKMIAKAMITYLEPMMGGNIFFESMKKTIEDCCGQSGGERCESASNFMSCCMAGMKNMKDIIMKMIM